jgi:cold shock CspA family protein
MSSATHSFLTGRVKWFNTKSGFGFITVVSPGEHNGADIFVHHSAANVSGEQYKYFIQGEYVEFRIEPTTDGNHKFQATQVSGILGGKLMCETRNEFKQQARERDAPRSLKTTVLEDLKQEDELNWNLVEKTSVQKRAATRGKKSVVVAAAL